MSIGIFDSGLGGLSVFKELSYLLPNEEYIYLGDTAGIPYGNKSPEIIIERVLHCARFFIEKKIKLLVIACFTASIHALHILQKELSIPIIGMIPTRIETVVSSCNTLALLGTSGTISSGKIQNIIQEKMPTTKVISISCPLFVPFIEEGLSEHPSFHMIAEHYLRKIKGVDTAFLACTHYPLIQSSIQKILGKKTKIINGSSYCANQVKETLFSLNLLHQGTRSVDHQFYVTADVERFEKSAQFFGFPITNTQKVI